MPAPSRWLVFLVLCAGCQSLSSPPPTAAASEPASRVEPPPLDAKPVSPGRQLWEEGQRAMREGQPEEAVRLYEQSLAADPTLTRNHLSLAAACLESGDQAAACRHLGNYIQAHPENAAIRVHHAELLWRLQRTPEARRGFEQTIAEAQDDLSIAHLLHCHSRLMQIAEAEANEYDEHLHRGIGLYLLARERAAGKTAPGAVSAEGLLCRAAAELTLARIERPDEARPCWYLYRVWSRLAQHQPAQRWLREASASAPFTYLTAAEQRGLQLACREQDSIGSRR